MSKLVDRKWQILPIITLSVFMLVGLYGFYITLERSVHDSVQRTTESLLTDVIYEIKEDAPSFAHDSDIDDYIGDLTQADADARIQVLDGQGTVVGDTALSDRALIGLESHSDRPEFVQAWENGSGYDVRFSEVLSVDLFYVSRKVVIDSQEFVVVLAVPMHHLKTMTSQLMAILGAMVVLSIGFLIATSIFSHRQIIHKVSEEQKKQDERIRQRTLEIELMHRLANMLAACNNLIEAQMVVEDIVPRILGKVNGSISLMRSSRNQLVTQLDWGDSWPGSRSFAPDECWSLRKGRSHLSIESFHNLTCEHMASIENNQTLCIPLTAHGNTIGIMHLYFGQGEIEVDEMTMQLSYSVAEHLGLALANLSLQEKLRSQALSDPLTGLYNRRFFEQKLTEHVNNSATSTEAMSLLMLDLDHFKRFNDNFGHDAGDYVLKEISALLKRTVSEDETACRLGGEELAVILPHCDMASATDYAQNIVDQIRALHLEHKGLSLGQLSVSIGVATYPEPASDIEGLVKMADKALYLAKDQGRDRVVNYQQYSEFKTPEPDAAEITLVQR
ncbi:sensor domain-containing diguanylate cyclase [Vibrio sp. Sgm 5]|uniref:sensor domain-containing diguanylate cyclase n=1 Tax=Vibrio sp. Sgm 5 TaxID=2994387 RepID=UPI0022488A8F|nr:sensor domain-containing diguanylate cyclase [Vibrio sp. Sgm 5]MCX2790837.1 sensor domain-containing diguanylate cyclase [Vibrio sp. Sgm 5]